MKLTNYDLIWAVRRLPFNLLTIMKEENWHNSIFVGGGYLRSIIANEHINDIDIFCPNSKMAELLAYKLCTKKEDIIKTDNAYTIRGKVTLQIIFRWVFDTPQDVSNSFDFTICCAVIFFDGKKFDSFCDDNFYSDLAAKRIVYRSPVRNEDAGGSMLRVLKYYQKGYRIPLDSLGAIIARLMKAVDFKRLAEEREAVIANVVTGLLREVDPAIDPNNTSAISSYKDIEL